jgi:hypothetical protein
MIVDDGIVIHQRSHHSMCLSPTYSSYYGLIIFCCLILTIELLLYLLPSPMRSTREFIVSNSQTRESRVTFIIPGKTAYLREMHNNTILLISLKKAIFQARIGVAAIATLTMDHEHGTPTSIAIRKNGRSR